MASWNTQGQHNLLHMDVSLASIPCKFRLKFVEYVTPDLNFVFLYLTSMAVKYILIWHKQVKVQVEGVSAYEFGWSCIFHYFVVEGLGHLECKTLGHMVSAA